MFLTVNSNGVEEECEETAPACKTDKKPKKIQKKPTEEPSKGTTTEETSLKKKKKKRKLADTSESPGNRWRSDNMKLTGWCFCDDKLTCFNFYTS